MSDRTLPAGWAARSVGDCAEVLVSNVDKKSVSNQPAVRLCNYMDVYSEEYLDHTRRYMRATATRSEIAKFSLRPGDVIITKDSETPDDIGVPSLVIDPGAEDDPLVCGYHLAIIRPDVSVDAAFVAKQLSHDRVRGYFARHAVGTTRYGLSNGTITHIPLWLPPKVEQTRIATVLRTLDEAIRTTEALIAKLEQVKKGLLHDLLTRGIDDNGELRDPERHPEQFKDSPLGRIPRDWDLCPLLDLAEVRSGIAKNSNRALNNPVDVHYLRVANVQDGFLDLSEMSKIRINRAEVAKYAVQAGDVLMNEGGDLDKLGRGALWRGEYHPCVHQNHVFVVRCRGGLEPAFLDAWTGSAPARRYFIVAGKQTTNLASINKTAISRLPVALPPMEEQHAIVQRLDGHRERVLAEEQSLKKLRLLKTGLMDDLLSGRVRVAADSQEVSA